MNKWLKLSPNDKELYLNPKKAVIEHSQLQAIATKSANEFRKLHDKKYLNISYVKRSNQKLDIFLPNNINNNPVQLYFHGGYWIGRDKFDHSHIAKPAVNNNIIHISVNYDLCPNVTLDIIVLEAQECIDWVIRNIKKYGGNPLNINLIGHSAGAHLVAMALTKNYSLNSFINSAILISGIYQPQITKYISINDIINIDDKTVKMTDVYETYIIQKTNILIIVGDEEPDPWKDLSKDLCVWLTKNKIQFEFFSALKLNHFTIVKALSEDKSALSQKVTNMSVKL